MINKISAVDFFEHDLSLNKTQEQETNDTFSFKEFLSDAMKETEALQQQTEQDGIALALGEIDNVAQIQVNSLKASAMLQTTVQLTSRTVSAYKEIMSMQV